MRNTYLTLRTAICLFFVNENIWALSGSQVSVTRSTEPYFILDSNNPCTSGPRASYVGIQVRNISGSTLNKINVKINSVTPSTKYYMIGTDSNRYVGRIVASDTGTAFFYIRYQCNADNDTCYLSFTITDSASGSVTFNTKVYTRSSISASAGGTLTGHTLSSAKSIGVLIADTVTYSYGNIGSGTEINFQPNGDTLFNPDKVIFINSLIYSSQIASISSGVRNKTYFTTTAATNGSNNIIKVIFFYINKMASGDSVLIHPFAGQTSGNTNYKYTGNYSDVAFLKYFVSSGNTITLTKSVTAVNNHINDTVLYKIVVKNTGSTRIIFDQIIDSLPLGYRYLSIDASSGVTNTNSSSLPSLNDSSVLFFKGGIQIDTFPYMTYSIAAGDSLIAAFKAKLISYSSAVDTNRATVRLGTLNAARDTATNEIFLRIAGQLFIDRGGLTDNSINGTNSNTLSGSSVFAYLISSTSNKIIDKVTLAGSANFQFNYAQRDSTYQIIVSTANLSIGSAAPSSAVLPSGWESVGDSYGTNNASGSGNETGTPNLMITCHVGIYDVSAMNFGVEQRPTANSFAKTSQVNPGGVVKVQSPALTGNDAEDGVKGQGSNFIILSLPTNASLYYNNVLVTANQVISNFDSTLLRVDPNFNGSGTVIFTFSPVDSAVKSATTPGTITIPFTSLSIGGTVYNDQGGLTDNTINGTGLGNPGGTALYANLIDSASGLVVYSVAVTAGRGVYLFSDSLNANTGYSVQISTNQGTAGASAPAAALPANWVSVGEQYGSNNASGTGIESGSPNGLIRSRTGSVNITAVNFGIEQISTAYSKSYSGINPNLFNVASGNSNYPYLMSLSNSSGTANGAVVGTSSTVLPGRVSGSDPEDGNYAGLSGSDGLRTFVLTTLPDSANDVMVYNGTVLKPGDVTNTYWNATNSRYEIPNFNSTLLNIYIRKNGHTTTGFVYGWLDSAGVLGSTASYSVSAYGALPVNIFSSSVKWNDTHPKIEWSTATEHNSKAYELERSIDGEYFEHITQIDAAGMSNVIRNYEFIDVYTNNGETKKVYYRINCIDLDNQISHRESLSIAGDLSTYSQNNVYPNPAKSTIYVACKGNYWVTIMDISGKKVFSGSISTFANEINVETLPTGTYHLILNNETEYITQRFVKFQE